MEKYFVNQKKHNSQTNEWVNDVPVKATKDAAMHQFHAFMSTYAYGQDEHYDYASCSVEDITGAVIKSEVDNRIPVEQPQANA